jgi:hypothetical protein
MILIYTLLMSTNSNENGGVPPTSHRHGGNPLASGNQFGLSRPKLAHLSKLARQLFFYNDTRTRELIVDAFQDIESFYEYSRPERELRFHLERDQPKDAKELMLILRFAILARYENNYDSILDWDESLDIASDIFRGGETDGAVEFIVGNSRSFAKVLDLGTNTRKIFDELSGRNTNTQSDRK